MMKEKDWQAWKEVNEVIVKVHFCLQKGVGQ